MGVKRNGGGSQALWLTTIGSAIAPAALLSGTLIQYIALGFLWWVVIAFVFVRLLATEYQHYWIGIGAEIGLGMMNKYAIPCWLAALALAVLLSARCKYLLSKWLWLASDEFHSDQIGIKKMRKVQ